MKARRALVAVSLAVAVAGGMTMIGMNDPVAAKCRIDQDCAPDPDATPPPAPSGAFTRYSFTTQACEPRLTPWHHFSYSAPGSTRTEIWHVGWDYSPQTLVGTFSNPSVEFDHQGHGHYLVKSFKGSTQVDLRDSSSC